MSARRLFARALFLQSGWNRERMQALGVTYALLPWAPRDPVAKRAFIRRHLAYVNTNPALAGILLGAVIGEEERLRAEALTTGEPGQSGDLLAQARVERWKRRLEGPLAAVGDRLFWGWLRPLLGVAGTLLLLTLALPGPSGWRWDPAATKGGTLLSAGLALAFYNVPYLATRWRAARRGLAAGRSPDPDRALAAILPGLGLRRLGAVLEWLGPILLGALAGRLLLVVARAGSETAAGPLPPLALAAAGLLLGAGGARFGVAPERLALAVLAFLLLGAA